MRRLASPKFGSGDRERERDMSQKCVFTRGSRHTLKVGRRGNPQPGK